MQGGVLLAPNGARGQSPCSKTLSLPAVEVIYGVRRPIPRLRDGRFYLSDMSPRSRLREATTSVPDETHGDVECEM